jgi:hypothetical protein
VPFQAKKTVSAHAVAPPKPDGNELAESKNPQPIIGMKIKSATATMKKASRVQGLLVRLCSIE